MSCRLPQGYAYRQECFLRHEVSASAGTVPFSPVASAADYVPRRPHAYAFAAYGLRLIPPPASAHRYFSQKQYAIILSSY